MSSSVIYSQNIPVQNSLFAHITLKLKMACRLLNSNVKTPCEVTDDPFAEHYRNLFKESCPENCSADTVIEAWGSSETRPDIDPLDEEYSCLNREFDSMRRLLVLHHMETY